MPSRPVEVITNTPGVNNPLLPNGGRKYKSAADFYARINAVSQAYKEDKAAAEIKRINDVYKEKAANMKINDGGISKKFRIDPNTGKKRFYSEAHTLISVAANSERETLEWRTKQRLKEFMKFKQNQEANKRKQSGQTEEEFRKEVGL